MREKVGTDGELLAALDQQNLAARVAESDAVSVRIERATEMAARLREPKVQVVSLERATLRSEQDVQDWLDRQQKRLLTGVKNGPVLIS